MVSGVKKDAQHRLDGVRDGITMDVDFYPPHSPPYLFTIS